MVGIDEQRLELDVLGVVRVGGEADDGALVDRGDRPALVHAGRIQVEQLGVGQQVRAVVLVGERGAPVHILKGVEVFDHRQSHRGRGILTPHAVASLSFRDTIRP